MSESFEDKNPTEQLAALMRAFFVETSEEVWVQCLNHIERGPNSTFAKEILHATENLYLIRRMIYIVIGQLKEEGREIALTNFLACADVSEEELEQAKKSFNENSGEEPASPMEAALLSLLVEAHIIAGRVEELLSRKKN